MSDIMTKQWPVSFEDYELLTEEEREVARVQCLASHLQVVEPVSEQELVLSSGHQLNLPEHGKVEIADIELVINDKTATAMLLLKVLKTGATLRLPLNQLVAEGLKIGHS